MAETAVLHIAQAESSAPAGAADAVQNGVVVEKGAAPATDAGQHAGTEVAHEGPVVFPPFDATNFASQIVWFVLTFAVLYVVLSRMAMPQISSILDKRKARIDGDLKEAERLRGETDKAVAAYEAALAEARSNAHAIAEETRSSIKADLDGKRHTVEAELSAKMAEAEGRIQKNKGEALGSVDEIAAETAVALVSQLIGQVSAKDARDAVAQVVKG